MMAMPCFGSWVAMVPASTRLALLSGALAGSCAPGSAVRDAEQDAPIISGLDVRRRALVRLGAALGDDRLRGLDRPAEQRDGDARQLHRDQRRQRERRQMGAVAVQAGQPFVSARIKHVRIVRVYRSMWRKLRERTHRAPWVP